jgi:hypothetical protein
MESAKRRVPHVSPVEAAGVRYQVVPGARNRGFSQNGGIIAAYDSPTGKEIWVLQVYETTYDPKEESDVQDRHITGLQVIEDGQYLRVEAEGGRTFRVRLSDRQITEVPRGG